MSLQNLCSRQRAWILAVKDEDMLIEGHEIGLEGFKTSNQIKLLEIL